MMDLRPFFDQYMALMRQADDVFDKIKAQYPSCVKCDVGCSDCCHAVFDLSLVEALFVNSRFKERLSEPQRQVILEEAGEADRKVYRLKRKAFKEHENGKSDELILEEMAEARIRCPLLDEHDHCALYEDRPLTCRFYGIPTAIGGKAHTCGKNDFEKGESYPTVHLEVVQNKLKEISTALAREIKSKYSELGEMLVPLSMALLTEYSEEYLGVKDASGEIDPEEGEKGTNGNES